MGRNDLISAALIVTAALGTGCARGLPEDRLADGFEAESIAPYWRPGSAGSGRYAPGAVVVSGDYARTGNQSVRITVKQGDIDQDGGDGARTERAELDAGKYALFGLDAWYGFSFLVPEGFPIVDNRLVIAQWKQDGVESPLIAERYRGGKHYVTINSLSADEAYRFPLPPIQLGKWNDMVFHVIYSAAENGLVEIWMNGEQIVTQRGSTADANSPNRFYNKIGLYRDRWEEPMTIYFDNYAMGKAWGDVNPALAYQDNAASNR